MDRILIVDDDIGLCKLMTRVIGGMGHDVLSALTIKDGLKALQSERLDVCFLDLKLPDGNGLELIPEIKKIPSSPEIIIITGFGDANTAEIAIREGVWDYLEKPILPQKLSIVLKNVLQYRKALNKTQPTSLIRSEGIAGSGPLIKECLKALKTAAISEVNVLLTGETGTGKDVFARTVHYNSSRSNKNFVVVDCASLPGTLIGSALFGYEKGAFTDAKQSQVGLIKQAHGGTLFLDEVSELPFDIQKTFLRVLDTHLFRPVGDKEEMKSDFRLIAATNRNLQRMVHEGEFRKDLFYRLNSFSIALPPLRERLEDIEELVRYHMSRLCKGRGLHPKEFSSSFFDFLSLYDWPGNVRELFNTIEIVMIQSRDEPVLFPRHLPDSIRIKVARESVAHDKGIPEEDGEKEKAAYPETIPPLRQFREATLEKAEGRYFLQLMAFTRGDIKEACRISGLSRSTLYNLLKKNGLSRTAWQTSQTSPR